MRKYLITLTELNVQFKKREHFFNKMGLLAFGLGISSLGTREPSICAFYSLAIISLMICSTCDKYTQFFALLRSKKDRTEKEENILKAIMIKYLNFKSLFTDYSIFTFGYLFLSCVTLSNSVSILKRLI